jgi:hypothetical protein
MDYESARNGTDISIMIVMKCTVPDKMYELVFGFSEREAEVPHVVLDIPQHILKNTNRCFQLQPLIYPYRILLYQPTLG